MKNLKLRLIVMNFLIFAVWGAYLTSMGGYLADFGNHLNEVFNDGRGNYILDRIGLFYTVQGVVSIFMPALLGIVADRYIQAQKVLSIAHFLAGIFMCAAGFYAYSAGDELNFWWLFGLYSCSVAFFMPTIGLGNSVSFNALTSAGMDTVKAFPPIRVFGTVGFICTMLAVDFAGLQHNYGQFFVSGVLSLVLGVYALTLPQCPLSEKKGKVSFVEAFGLKAFKLFKDSKMAIFFIFSMLLGVSLQITNSYANGYISSFADIEQFANTFGAQHANALISLSQISETLCILLIPFCMKRFGIKNVMLIAMFAWVFRFGLFGAGNPGPLVWMFILSCIVYGVAFDFFNISGALYVDTQTSSDIRSSAQGLFMLMTNGIGATIGTLVAQCVVNYFVNSQGDPVSKIAGWSTTWYVFAGYALVVAVLFMFIFKSPKNQVAKES